jgi:hypothetical protein
VDDDPVTFGGGRIPGIGIHPAKVYTYILVFDISGAGMTPQIFRVVTSNKMCLQVGSLPN